MKLLVAIRCLVFNHEPYLRDCLNGFVMQKTNFRFVVIVHDDCSTDSSAAIIREYAEKYPDIIRPIYEVENQYSKHDGSLARVMKEAVDATSARYVAVCEGDDYWTDPYKLQKQVDYMEAHPECALCFHPVMVHDQRTGEDYPNRLEQVPAITKINDLAKRGNYIHTPSVMYRYNPEANHTMEQLGRIGVGDYLQHLLYAQYGNICKLPDYMAVYRQGVGVWSGNKVPFMTDVQWLIAIAKVFALIDDAETKKLLDEQIQTYADSILGGIESAQIDATNARQSKAYKLGKALLKPFSWLKKK